MQQDLLDALRKEYAGETSPIMRQHLDWATSSRRRATELADELVATTDFAFTGKKILDVGCAHAGLVIEAAARGAVAWGVEISRKLWEQGKLAARGEPGELHLIPGNFTSAQVGSALPHDFDFVFINDVFEHIYDTASLLEQVQRVTAPGAGVYFSIPSRECVRFVESEGHYGVAGLSLIPANWWHALLPSFTAFYRPWSFYSGLFRAFGFHEIQAWRDEPLPHPDDIRGRITSGVERAARAIQQLTYLDEKARPVVTSAFEEYAARVAVDLKEADPELLHWRYLTDFWRGCVYKAGPSLADADVAPTFARSIASATRQAPSAPAAAAVAEAPFRRVKLEVLSPEELACRQHLTDVKVSRDPGGAIRCEVVGHADAHNAPYGGLRIPTGPFGTVRLDLEFLDIDGIDAIYVDGLDLRRCRVLRWLWRCKVREGGPPGPRAIHTLVPGRDAGPFLPRDEAMPALVSDLQLYVRLRGKRATILLHGAEVR